MVTAISSEVNSSPLPAGISGDSIRAQVQRMLDSPAFARSERKCRLVRYLVERTLDGSGGHLKEYVIGVEVFGLRDTFDPQTDPIVRMALSRLRATLKEYYQTDGRVDSLIIDLPKRSYSLTFQLREAPAAASRTWNGTLTWFGWRRMAVTVSVIMFITMVTSIWALARSGDHGRSAGTTAVAVLPFVNLSSDPESGYIGEGLTEELMQGLAKIDGLRVISRTSVFQFKGKHEAVQTIASQLNADLVLEGTVRKSGDRLRVSTRLINGRDGHELNSEVYERPVGDSIDLQQRIAWQVANTLRGHGEHPPDTQSTRSVEAMKAYLEGSYHTNGRSETELKKAIHYYERATAADPGFSLAHARLADAYVLLARLNEAPPGEAMRRAKDAALRAVTAGPDISHGHSALGSVLALHDWDWAGADREFRRAINLDPNDARIRVAYAAHCLLPQGRLDSASFEMRLAQSLDPLSPEIGFGLGRVHYFKREPDRAVEAFQRVVLHAPDFGAAPLALAKAYVQKSHVDRALDTLHEASAPTEAEARLAVLGYAYALSGQPDQARQILERLRRVVTKRYVSGYYFALIHLALGEKAEALDWLEQAAAERSPFIVYLKVNPSFDSLRNEPRFTALLGRVGLGA